MDNTTAYRILILFLGVAGIITWSIWGKRSKNGLFAVAPLSWLIHLVIFYGLLLIQKPAVGNPMFTTWSLTLRLHAAFLVSFGGLVVLLGNGRSHD